MVLKLPRSKKPLSQEAREKKRAYETKRRQFHLESEKERMKEYRRRQYATTGHTRITSKKAVELYDWMQKIKSKPCADCKQSFQTCSMDFDHRPGEVKIATVAYMFAAHHNRAKIEAEVAKCDLVCANCHRVRTRDRKVEAHRKKHNERLATQKHLPGRAKLAQSAEGSAQLGRIAA